MKAVKSSVTRGIPVGSIIKVADNSGAKLVQIASVSKCGTTKRRRQSAGVGDLVNAVVKVGKPDMKHKMVPAVIIRQKQPFKRANGERIRFTDNAAVILKDIKEAEPKGTFIKGAVAKEATIRWPHVAKIASMVV